jgi:tripartite-type tricarboxylate transporter receptor subunit TctC
MFSTTIGILPRVRSGQLRALAISSGRRVAAAPDLATISEAGLAGFDVVAWFGLFVPAGTPPALLERLSRETRGALAAADVRNKLVDLGAEPLGSTPQEFAAYVQAESARWGKLAKEKGIRAD